jgi:secondary thiamine-phosphate synthase enzyme
MDRKSYFNKSKEEACPMSICRTIKTVQTTKCKQLIDITDQINQFVKESGIKYGSLVVQTLHTTMGLIIQELTEPRLCRDIIKHMDSFLSSDVKEYEHNDLQERPEVSDKENEPLNGKSHIQSMLLNQQLVLDICEEKVTLGKWQRIGLLELDGPRENRSFLIKAWEDQKSFQILTNNFVEKKFVMIN